MIRSSLVLAIVVLAAGCAGAQVDPDAPQACVVVDNREGTGTQARMFLIGLNDRSRTRMGEVAMGRSTRFCTNRVTLPGSYKVVVEEPASDRIDPATGVAGSMTGGGVYNNQARPIESPDFFLEPGDVWTWDVKLDRLSCAPNAAGVGGDC
jgi:hypothetical protein